jgi:cysteinyl-tRNA synthetase
MAIKLYNTKVRKKVDLEPIDPTNVRMYVCGPTVYDRAHLGNARPVIVFDTLFRLLRHTYGIDHVTYVRNFTDVDDRINQTAQDRKAGGALGTLEELIATRADDTIGWYHEDMDAVGALRPSAEPRATGYIDEMISMIQGLERDGFAYEKDGHVLFRVRKYEAYGALSGRSVDDMIAGARVEVAPYKEDPMDFVLWKPSSNELPGWVSPWGRGRPGWHIECSAMAAELLGPEFDIHGGGNDLTFPHHENEIAQSACAGHGFANIWMHNEMLQVEGMKMSKSLGNFFTVRDLLDQGVAGEVIRAVMLGTHYRKPMDWTEKKRVEAEGALRRWRSSTANIDAGPPDAAILAALGDDLNTPDAMTHVYRLSKVGDLAGLKGSAQMLGLLSDEMGGWDTAGIHQSEREKIEQIESWLIAARNTAKLNNDYAAIDWLKSQAHDAGLEVRMSKDSVEVAPKANFDSEKLWTITPRVPS